MPNICETQRIEEKSSNDIVDLGKQTELEKVEDMLPKYSNIVNSKLNKINTPQGNPLQNNEKDSHNHNLFKIKESIEIKGELANIQKIRNLEGNIILECRGNTPYINKNIIEDIIGFASEFFEKTKTALSLNNAYRTMDYQRNLKRTKGKMAAESGKSGHNLGLSIDIDKIDRYNIYNGGIKGMRLLAEKYNFISNILDEDWHFDHKTLPDSSKRLALAKHIDKSMRINV